MVTVAEPIWTNHQWCLLNQCPQKATQKCTPRSVNGLPLFRPSWEALITSSLISYTRPSQATAETLKNNSCFQCLPCLGCAQWNVGETILKAWTARPCTKRRVKACVYSNDDRKSKKQHYWHVLLKRKLWCLLLPLCTSVKAWGARLGQSNCMLPILEFDVVPESQSFQKVEQKVNQRNQELACCVVGMI